MWGVKAWAGTNMRLVLQGHLAQLSARGSPQRLGGEVEVGDVPADARAEKRLELAEVREVADMVRHARRRARASRPPPRG